MAVKNFNFKIPEMADSRHLENRKIAKFYDDTERISQACRPSAVLDCQNVIFNWHCTVETPSASLCQILWR